VPLASRLTAVRPPLRRAIARRRIAALVAVAAALVPTVGAAHAKWFVDTSCCPVRTDLILSGRTLVLVAVALAGLGVLYGLQRVLGAHWPEAPFLRRMAVGAPTLSVAARHFAKEDIDAAQYTWQLPRREQVLVNLDWKQMGVGGIDSWSPNAWPLPPYRLDASQPMSFKYRLSPIDGDFTPRTKEAF